MLIKLADSSDEDEFQALFDSDSYNFRYDNGVAKSASKINLSDKEKILNVLCLHYTILTSLAELEQLRRGLSIQKFDSLMKSHPQLIRQAFLPLESSITSVYLPARLTSTNVFKSLRWRVTRINDIHDFSKYLYFLAMGICTD